jgi:hypothetical protein
MTLCCGNCGEETQVYINEHESALDFVMEKISERNPELLPLLIGVNDTLDALVKNKLKGGSDA